MDAVLISIGGAVGASSRYLVGQLIAHYPAPWAAFAVNTLGSFLLGVVVFGVNSSEVALVVGVGFCGAFTTFSSFSYQTVRLWEQGDHGQALLNVGSSLFGALLAFGCAWLLLG